MGRERGRHRLDAPEGGGARLPVLPRPGPAPADRGRFLGRGAARDDPGDAGGEDRAAGGAVRDPALRRGDPRVDPGAGGFLRGVRGDLRREPEDDGERMRPLEGRRPGRNALPGDDRPRGRGSGAGDDLRHRLQEARGARPVDREAVPDASGRAGADPALRRLRAGSSRGQDPRGEPEGGRRLPRREGGASLLLRRAGDEGEPGEGQPQDGPGGVEEEARGASRKWYDGKKDRVASAANECGGARMPGY